MDLEVNDLIKQADKGGDMSNIKSAASGELLSYIGSIYSRTLCLISILQLIRPLSIHCIVFLYRNRAAGQCTEGNCWIRLTLRRRAQTFQASQYMETSKDEYCQGIG